MTRGSCLTFQLSVPSRQQPHPMAKWELGLGQRGGSGAASQAPSVWVSLAWDGAAGRLNRAGHGGRQHPSCCLSALHPYTTVLHFSQALGTQLAPSVWGHVPGMGLWQRPRLLLLTPCFPCRQVLHADVAFLRGCRMSSPCQTRGPCLHRAIPEGCHGS